MNLKINCSQNLYYIMWRMYICLYKFCDWKISIRRYVRTVASSSRWFRSISGEFFDLRSNHDCITTRNYAPAIFLSFVFIFFRFSAGAIIRPRCGIVSCRTWPRRIEFRDSPCRSPIRILSRVFGILFRAFVVYHPRFWNGVVCGLCVSVLHRN